MKKIVLPFIVLATSLAIACNNGDKTSNDSVEMAKDANNSIDSTKGTGDSLATDENFLVEAASGGMMEVELGKIAATNAASPQVKEFGQLMVSDHTKSDAELTTIARLKNIAIPNMPGEDHMKHINDLKNKKGADFDKAYMSMMTDDHEEDVRKFEKASKDAKDQDIKSFAAKTLPVLKQHLEKAKAVKDGLK
ncbi:MAG: hypothetical protein JWN76_1325 [Chitinophagaceae bacterium]|nr:hypothetical protein [Chitinophagaceae bacterium]